MKRPEEEWKKRLPPEKYHVLREKGTEPPFTGALLNNKDSGMYECAACNAPLFKSNHKFDSGSGWPSFYDVVSSEAVNLIDDLSHGMHRVEIECSSCGGHLGHLFDDAHDQPGGKRYCINSASLEFKKDS